jgi:hypothetical protein
MRDLVDSRVRLAVSLTNLAAIPEICATEYLIPGHEMIDSCCAAAIPRSLEA